MSQAWVNQLQPQLRAPAEALVSRFLQGGHVSSVYRSYEAQRKLYDRWVMLRRQGLTNEEVCRHGICTPAPPGHSLHQQGRAFDVTAPIELLQRAGAIWKAAGGRWYPQDPIHFEA